MLHAEQEDGNHQMFKVTSRLELALTIHSDSLFLLDYRDFTSRRFSDPHLTITSTTITVT